MEHLSRRGSPAAGFAPLRPCLGGHRRHQEKGPALDSAAQGRRRLPKCLDRPTFGMGARQEKQSWRRGGEDYPEGEESVTSYEDRGLVSVRMK